MISGCNPAKLTGNITESVPEHSGKECGARHAMLAIRNGFVCYSGTEIGSSAVYYCSNCGYNSLTDSAQSFIQVCKENGEWDGEVPTCDCGEI